MFFSENNLSLIVKLMKGDSEFRLKTKSTIQFSNENYVYKNIIPYYKDFLDNSVTFFDINQWTPCVYYVNSGQLEGKQIFKLLIWNKEIRFCLRLGRLL